MNSFSLANFSLMYYPLSWMHILKSVDCCLHIPKCAGSDLSVNLVAKYPSISWQITQPAWTSKRELFSSLRDVVLRLRLSDTLFVRGHIPLTYYSHLHLIRPGDEVFTILREPHDIAISQINYVLTRLRRNESKVEPDPDVKAWLQSLDLSSAPENLTDELVKELATKMIYSESIVTRNPLCSWLGGGTAAEVLEQLALNQVDVTDTVRYQAWLNEKWAITSSSRENAY